jgi:hypothetical protein
MKLLDYLNMNLNKIFLFNLILLTLLFDYNSIKIKGENDVNSISNSNNCNSIDGKELFLAQICKKNIFI